ncbi:peptidoglycan editing factor PgeF [Nocardioides bruguierae]|uniref:Purine nucleoside phosphorylase n=1 Tax=Nocardioides bruguierae TaxID=2945102 RepID=A0A9X2D975_9ACTN|nr:peptidoglycan editing factor PgeF [Nocardioides bruguierae]MCM0621612.1 peptidoglycan editing factor PgeF [Nocardioides bruguierae]
MFHFRTRLSPPDGGPGVDVAFTDRWGGVSAPPFDELNLAIASADDPSAVAENHRRLLAALAPGAQLADLVQVHGCEVDVAEPDPDRARPEADGIVATSPDLVLMVRAADCVPVVLADPAAGVVGAAHAGRAGVERQVVVATVERMRALGAVDVTAWIGPHVCGGCYEVPQDMQDDVVATEPATRATTSWGTPSLDLGAGVAAQLERCGVTVLREAATCTRTSADLYSHRRDGAGAGRLAGLVRLVPAEQGAA